MCTRCARGVAWRFESFFPIDLPWPDRHAFRTAHSAASEACRQAAHASMSERDFAERLRMRREHVRLDCNPRRQLAFCSAASPCIPMVPASAPKIPRFLRVPATTAASHKALFCHSACAHAVSPCFLSVASTCPPRAAPVNARSAFRPDQRALFHPYVGRRVVQSGLCLSACVFGAAAA